MSQTFPLRQIAERLQMEVSVARVEKVLRSTLGHGSECSKACVTVTGVRGL